MKSEHISQGHWIAGCPEIPESHVARNKWDIGEFREYRGLPEIHARREKRNIRKKTGVPENSGKPGHWKLSGVPRNSGKQDIHKIRGYLEIQGKLASLKSNFSLFFMMFFDHQLLKTMKKSRIFDPIYLPNWTDFRLYPKFCKKSCRPHPPKSYKKHIKSFRNNIP